MDLKLWTLPSGLVLIDVVGLTNSVGFVVKIFGLVVSISLPTVVIEVSLLSWNEAVFVIFDADVEPGAVEVVVIGVNVAKWNKNFSIYHNQRLNWIQSKN